MEQGERRALREFGEEFKARTVEMIESSGKSIAEVCRELDLTETAVRRWVKQARIDQRAAPALTSDERAELARLRCENKVLREKREILNERSRRVDPLADAAVPEEQRSRMSCGGEDDLQAVPGRGHRREAGRWKLRVGGGEEHGCYLVGSGWHAHISEGEEGALRLDVDPSKPPALLIHLHPLVRRNDKREPAAPLASPEAWLEEVERTIYDLLV